MSSLEELKDALRDTLAARGSLGQIQARVRAEIFNALEETVAPCSICPVVFSLPESSSL
jgi:lisH domain-containing protein FOPNL